MKNLIFILLAGALPHAIQAQSGKDLTFNFNTDVRSALKVEPYLGGSASIAFGDYIDYHRSFLGGSEEGSKFGGSILPLPMVTGCVQARYALFTDGILESLNLSVGLQYMQRGFINRFHMRHDFSSGITDKSTYREIYRHNYLAVPVHLRWGTKWFITVGGVLGLHINSTRAQILNREQSGAEAFENKSRNNDKIPPSVFKKTHTNISVGGGYQFSESLAAGLRVYSGSEIFQSSTDAYRTIQVEFAIFHKIKIFK